MADGLLEAVRGLWLAHPELGPKPLLAKLREQQPDLGAGNKEVCEALLALKAESQATEAAATVEHEEAAERERGPVIQVELAGRVFRYPPSKADRAEAEEEEEAEGIPDVEWLLEYVRKQAASRHGLLLEPPLELRYCSTAGIDVHATGTAGLEVSVGASATGGGGRHDAAPPKDRGDNQVTGALLHKDTSLHALVERGGGLRVTLLTLRCGFAPAWSCEEAYRRHCTKDGVEPRDSVAGALARDGAVERRERASLRIERSELHGEEMAPLLRAVSSCGSWLGRLDLTAGSLGVAQLGLLLRLLPPRHCALQALDLSSQHLFGPQPLAALCDAAAAGALPSLAKLDLRFNPLTDAAAAALPRLLSPEAAWQLAEVSLHGCMLGGAAAHSIAAALSGEAPTAAAAAGGPAAAAGEAAAAAATAGAAATAAATAATAATAGAGAGARPRPSSRLTVLDLGCNDEIVSSTSD